MMKLRICKRRHRIQSIEEMEQILQEEWDNLKPEDWKSIFESMRKRCLAVIKAKGGSIRY
jgi:hypothetical protein